MAAPPTGGEGGSMVPTEWVQILQKWCNDHNSSFPKGLATRLNVVGAVPLWWIIGLELMPQALLIPPSANLGKRPREQVVPYVDTAFADGQLHAKPKPKPAAAQVQRKSYGKHVLGKSRDNQAKAGDETAEMIAKVEKLRADPKYRNAGLTFAQAKTLVGNQTMPMLRGSSGLRPSYPRKRLTHPSSWVSLTSRYWIIFRIQCEPSCRHGMQINAAVHSQKRRRR